MVVALISCLLDRAELPGRPWWLRARAKVLGAR